jgi:hypothetical protein
MTVTVLVRDQNRIIRDALDVWTKVSAPRRFNEIANGSLTFPGHVDLRALFDPGWGVVVVRDGKVWKSGSIVEDGPYTWSAEPDDADAGPGTQTITFDDDLARIAHRITYPIPNQPASLQQDQAYWRRTNANAEETIREIIDLNAGPNARAERRQQGLVFGPIAGVGGLATINSRFQPLLDEVRAIASAGGGLGVEAIQVGNQIQVTVFSPQDRSADARFSRDLGNLRRLGFNRIAPKATTCIVGGGGTGTERYIIERTDSDAETEWAERIELFLDRRDAGSEDLTLAQAGDEVLTENARTVALEVALIDTTNLMYGRDYGLGDTISIDLGQGLAVTDLIREVQLEATPQDESVIAIVGSTDTSGSSDPLWLRPIAELDRRLSRQETV